ncbi:hypothetical protein V1291_002419 [Nitrobacteraceae bacterium AZCC 1564]
MEKRLRKYGHQGTKHNAARKCDAKIRTSASGAVK